MLNITAKLTAAVSLLLLSLLSYSQVAPFTVHMEPMSVTDLGGLQAYAFGQHDGKWLIIGGRLDGLHRRQPWAAFDVAGNNNQLIVVDPIAKKRWTMSITSLSTALQEQMSSTNMEFHQDGDYLYIIGGYGFNAATNRRMTFNQLTAVDVPSVIDAVINSKSIVNHFRQITDNEFAVTGGHLKKINNTYYLLCGNKFDGDYNPMGGGSYTQEYTEAIRKFTLIDDGTTIKVTHLTPMIDAANLHRRDYNAVPQILPNGEEGITIFSGVFQPTLDLPFLSSVTVDSSSYAVDKNFQQYYNHYHGAVVPIYATNDNEMHNIFFGGIAQYYDSAGTLIQDNDVPFVKTIARVTRTSNGSMAEYKLPIEMPSLMGASAEFIPNEKVPSYNNGVFNFDDFTSDSTLVGYIYGGISSTEANIFFTNNGTQSSASNQVFKVYIVKNGSSNIDQLNEQSIGSLKMQVYPNPSNGHLSIRFNLRDIEETVITVYNQNGQKLEEKVLTNLHVGVNVFTSALKGFENGGTYLISIETPSEKATQKVVIQK